ncbi:hypothetical protein GCM10022285_09400 [Streptomyces tunisiensis]|uniref:Uncharacterized protein n=1 Tax=Streptomyces tunisiensis TaxID=948699 RepID=A0ABP7XU35_9ACTN
MGTPTSTVVSAAPAVAATHCGDCHAASVAPARRKDREEGVEETPFR